jgi:hypothetical protein
VPPIGLRAGQIGFGLKWCGALFSIGVCFAVTEEPG